MMERVLRNTEPSGPNKLPLYGQRIIFTGKSIYAFLRIFLKLIDRTQMKWNIGMQNIQLQANVGYL